MGGYGSGRWGWYRARGMTAPEFRLDVRWLVRQGLVAPGVAGSLAFAWTSGGRPAGEVLAHHETNAGRRVATPGSSDRHRSALHCGSVADGVPACP